MRQPTKRGFILYQRWPKCVHDGPRVGDVAPEFDKLTPDEIAALTVVERNAVGGKIEASE
jgi:hypothetical protein